MNSGRSTATRLPSASDADQQVVLPDAEALEARARGWFAQWGVLDRLAHVEVRWNPRLRTTAGRAHLRTLQIQLNPHLLAKAPAAIDAVLAHEAAHLAAWMRFGEGVQQHGPEWVELLETVGMPARRTHDLPVGDLRRGRSLYLHRCGGCGLRRIDGRRRLPPACACPAAATDLFRAPATAAGRAALERFGLPQAGAGPAAGGPVGSPPA